MKPNLVKLVPLKYFTWLLLPSQEVLAKVPDPVTTFATDEKEMKENYKAHVTAQLKHDFPDFKQSYMQSVVEKHHYHLLPIVKELEAAREEILGEIIYLFIYLFIYLLKA